MSVLWGPGKRSMIFGMKLYICKNKMMQKHILLNVDTTFFSPNYYYEN